MVINIRCARMDDIEAIIPYIKMAAGGISEFLFKNVFEDFSDTELLEIALTDENTSLYYQNFLIVEQDHRMIGASNYYPAEQHGLPDIMKSLIPSEKLDVVKHYLESKVKGSMYIHTLGIEPGLRNRSVALLIGKIEEIAKQQKKRCLSAHVWRGNKMIYHALKMAGAEIVQHIPIPDHPLFQYQGGMVLMKGPDFK